MSDLHWEVREIMKGRRFESVKKLLISDLSVFFSFNKKINFDSKISAIFPRLPKHHANPILTKAFLKQKVNTRFIIINSRLSVCENEWKIT